MICITYNWTSLTMSFVCCNVLGVTALLVIPNPVTITVVVSETLCLPKSHSPKSDVKEKQ